MVDTLNRLVPWLCLANPARFPGAKFIEKTKSIGKFAVLVIIHICIHVIWIILRNTTS